MNEGRSLYGPTVDSMATAPADSGLRDALIDASSDVGHVPSALTLGLDVYRRW